MRKMYVRMPVGLLGPMIIMAVLVVSVVAFRHGGGTSVFAKADDQTGGHRCSLHSAHGTYGFALTGSLAAIGPIATSGTSTFDGEGKDVGKFAVTTFGVAQEFTFTGTYTANADCTGTATLNVTPGVFGFNVLHFTAVGTDNDKEIKWLITDPGIILAGTLTKQ